MADLVIAEFSSPVSGVGSYVGQVLPQPALAVQHIALGGASVPITLSAKTNAVELYAEAACHFAFGSANGGAVVAAATDQSMGAGERRIYACSPGQIIAALT